MPKSNIGAIFAYHSAMSKNFSIIFTYTICIMF